MNRAYIKNANEDLVGAINEEPKGFQIVWRARMENSPGNTHSVDQEWHPTIEAARQAVWKKDPNLMVIDAK